MSNATLRPCIFCGHEEPVSGSSVMQIHCPKCLALGPAGHTADEAAALWNRRDVQLGDLPPGYDDHCGCVDEPGSYGRRCHVCAASAEVATRLLDRCLLEEIDELRTTLAWYADQENWKRSARSPVGGASLAESDQGERARKALATDDAEDREQLEGFNCSAGFCGGLGQ